MTPEEAKKEIIDMANALQLIPNTPKGKAVSMAIKALEQEPKTGHWIMTHDYFAGAYENIDYVKCSFCHADSLEEGNYCPNCGAEMSEVKE